MSLSTHLRTDVIPRAVPRIISWLIVDMLAPLVAKWRRASWFGAHGVLTGSPLQCPQCPPVRLVLLPPWN